MTRLLQKNTDDIKGTDSANGSFIISKHTEDHIYQEKILYFNTKGKRLVSTCFCEIIEDYEPVVAKSEIVLKISFVYFKFVCTAVFFLSFRLKWLKLQGL